MDLEEKTLERDIIYQGKFLRLRRDAVSLPNGTRALREVVEHPGAVAVLPLDEAGNVILVEQYRHPLEQVLLEIPAGKLEPGEEPRLCALRELEEETGLVPDTLEGLGSLYISPGFCNEVIHLYLARGLRPGTAHPDEDEFLNRRVLPFSELARAVMQDEVRDAKTVAAVLKVKGKLGL
ncbi:Methanol dehydrogenase activator [bioreactor metagenome]|uniref:Methanol dehydrogenase activator n=1 Tax=bioreactor metagenome TaxID=1076179 RepID=A0A644ZQV7_9ZZZZ